MIILYTFAINIAKMKRILILLLAFQALSSFAQTPDWQEDMQEWTTMEDMGDNTNMELLEDLVKLN